MNILYLCDKRACKECHEECSHTPDITHARNFQLTGDGFFEKSSPRAILKFNQLLSVDARNRAMAAIKKQLDENGIIAVGPEVDPVVLDGTPVFELTVRKMPSLCGMADKIEEKTEDVENELS